MSQQKPDNKPGTGTPNKSTTTQKPAASKATSTQPARPASAAAGGKKPTPKQLAMQKRQAQRQRNQIILVGLGVVVVAIIGIITVLVLSTPTKFAALPASVTQDTDRMTLGSVDAPVTLIEYADVRCPACKTYFDTIEPEVRENYIKTGKIKYIYKNLTIIDGNLGDTESARAGQAMQCAADQKRGFDFRDSLYKNYKGEARGIWTDKTLKDLASALNLDTGQFNSCLESNKYKQLVTDETAEGRKRGLNSTPSFVIKYGTKDEIMNFNTWDEFRAKLAEITAANPPKS